MVAPRLRRRLGDRGEHALGALEDVDERLEPLRDVVERGAVDAEDFERDARRPPEVELGALAMMGRMQGGIRPILASAHLTGIGFASQKRSRCSACSGASAASAALRSRAFAAAITFATPAGATFAVTEMAPSPPCST